MSASCSTREHPGVLGCESKSEIVVIVWSSSDWISSFPGTYSSSSSSDFSGKSSCINATTSESGSVFFNDPNPSGFLFNCFAFCRVNLGTIGISCSSSEFNELLELLILFCSSCSACSETRARTCSFLTSL